MEAATRPQSVYKVVLVGSLGVGKTSLFWRLKTGQFMEHVTGESDLTISTMSLCDCCIVCYVMDSGRDVQLEVWDTVGMERQNRLPHNYFRQARAVALLYDITQFDSLTVLSPWLEQRAAIPPNTLKVLVGCKSDLLPDITQELVHAFMEDNQIDLHFNVSSKEGSGVSDAFKAIARALYRREQSSPLEGPMEQSQTDSGIAVVGARPMNSSNSCCSFS